MSHETFDLIERLRHAERRAAMATLVRTSGTTPRKEGTKMFVTEGGEIFGSVTIGGCVDARVIEQAAEVLPSSTPRLLSLQLGDEEAWEIGLTCGGTVDVFVEPLTSELTNVYDAAQRAAKEGRSVALVTVLSEAGAGSLLLIDADGTILSGALSTSDEERIRQDARRLLQGSGGSRTITYPGPIDVYIEVVRPPWTLVVFGAGAVAIPLVSFAKTLGFQTILIDGRERFANRDRFPDADEIRVGIASEIARQLELGPTTPVVLVAHDYKIDVPVLTHVLSTTAPYVGLLGSRKRGAAILQLLRDCSVPEERLERVRVPIGLDLGGETAAEIALSIASEILAVLRGRSGSALSAKRAAPVEEAALQRP